jgi:hypothetical protein
MCMDENRSHESNYQANDGILFICAKRYVRYWPAERIATGTVSWVSLSSSATKNI